MIEDGEELQQSGGESEEQESPAPAQAEAPQQEEQEQEASGEGTEEAAAAAPAPAAPQTPPKDWKDRRIDRLTAQLNAARREVEAAKAAGTPPPAAAEERLAASEADLEALIEQRAQERAVQQEFTRRCNETADAGVAEFGDAEFRGRVQNLVGLVQGGGQDELARYYQLLGGAIDTGKGPALLHHLGGDLNEASRLLELSPTRMGIELERLARRLGDAGAAPAPSDAPRPIRPVGQAGNGSRATIAADDAERADQLSTAEWMRRRNAQVEKQRGR